MFLGVGSFIHDHYDSAVVDLYVSNFMRQRIPGRRSSNTKMSSVQIFGFSMQKPEQLLGQRSCQRSNEHLKQGWGGRTHADA